ncbi:MAG: winged helix-turn-helix domain-containing protein [Nitrospiraceae bacterium]
MRRKGTSAQLAVVRQRGLKLLDQGKKPGEVADLLGVTARTVHRWRYEAKHPRKKAARPPGRPRKLSSKQVQRLEKALDRGAYAFGYAEDYWTLDRIAQVIWQLFEVRYTPSAVWHVMQRMGWSSQRPQRVALQRDDEAVVQWKKEEQPRIKKVSPTGRYPRFGR